MMEGVNVTESGTCHRLITMDSVCCAPQEWTLDGRWKSTIGNSLRSDGQSIKCRNSTDSPRPLYQRVELSEGHHTVQFLAFTDGSELSASDVVPFAAQPEEDGSPGANEIQSGDRQYADYVLTVVNFTPPGNRSACFITGEFTVGSGESGLWDIGAEVQGNKLVYVASVTCFKTGEL